MPAPIVLFAFNRPDHLRRTLESLAANGLAPETDLTIFCDGPRNDAEREKTDAVRAVARAAPGFHSCAVVERGKNHGLAASIIAGVTELVSANGRVIVLEDDMVTSPHFLRYMNEGLEAYAEVPEVASIHGWCFPHTVQSPPETFFLRGADCWGWATWKRAWDIFEPDAGKLLTRLRQRGLNDAFDLEGAYSYTDMLRATQEGKISSWAVRWHASAFLAGMYTLHPGRSLVKNIGLDASGTHCGVNREFEVVLAKMPVIVAMQPVEESALMRQAQKDFYHSSAKMAGSSKIEWKALVKDCLPPILLRALQKLRRRSDAAQSLSWQGDYPDWQSAVAASEGYDREAIFLKVRDAARAVRDGKALWERDSVLFYHEEYNLPLVAALMSVAAANKGRLRVLDFGGAFGSTYMQHRPLLQKLDALSWNIVEQPHFVACGQEEFSTEELRFWPTMQACAEAGPVDAVLFSSVLQYMEDPYASLEQAVAFNPQAIILDRTPFAESGERITVQIVPPEIYAASYPCRWLDRSRVDRILEKRYHCLPNHSTHIDPSGFYGFVAVRKE